LHVRFITLLERRFIDYFSQYVTLLNE